MAYQFLRFDPDQLPALTATLSEAVSTLERNLSTLADGARVTPWLGDEVSAQIAARYHEVALDGKNSALNVLGQYVQHVKDVIRELEATAAAYTSTDTSAASRLGSPG